MANILILSPEIPYPVFKGNQNRIDETINLLIAAGHDVALVALNSIQRERTSVSIEKDLYARYVGIKIVAIRRHPRFSKGMQNHVHNLLKKFDKRALISNIDTCPHVFRRAVAKIVDEFNPEYIFVNYLKLTKAIPSSFSGKRVVDCHDLQSSIIEQAAKLKPQKVKTSINMANFSKEEFNLLSKYDQIVSINQNETNVINRNLPNSNIQTIPAFCKIVSIAPRDIFRYDILFVGSSSPFNIEGIVKFLVKSLPQIKNSIPSAKIAIVGDVSNCAALRKFDDDSLVIKLGRVGDIGKIYQDAKIVISPILSGAGMKVKNIEAFCYGKAVVATEFSLDGICATHNKNVFIANEWDKFAEYCIKLLEDDSARKRLEQGARDLAVAVYSLEAANESFGKIFGIPLKPVNSYVTANKNALTKKDVANARQKALIFSMDAMALIKLNIYIGKTLRRIGVYTEFFKMERSSEYEFLKEGFLVHALRPLLDKKLRKELNKKLDFTDADIENFTFSWHGVDLSDDIKIYHQMFPEHFKKNGLKSIIVHGVVILESLLALIDKVNPSFLVGWNGNGPHLIFLVKIASKIKKIPVFYVERGLLPETIVFDSRGVNFKSSVAGSFLPLINTHERSEAISYIQKFRRDRRSIVNNNEISNISEKDLKDKLGLREIDKYIIFILQIEGDSNIVINSPFFKKMASVIDMLSYITRQLDLRLVCRPHPEGGSCSELESIFPDVMFDATTHLHSILEYSVACIVINSTVGLESIILGKPTVALGFSTYSNKGITFDAYDASQVVEALSCIINGNGWNEFKERKTEELVHYLLNSCLLDLNNDLIASIVAKKVLSNNQIFVSDSIATARFPRRVERYQSKLNEAICALSSAKKLLLINIFRPGTCQYLTGVDRPIITDELIIDYFDKLFPGEVCLIADKITSPTNLVKKYKARDVQLVLLVNSDTYEIFSNKSFLCCDEYFNVRISDI